MGSHQYYKIGQNATNANMGPTAKLAINKVFFYN